MSKGNSNLFSKTTGARKALIDEVNLSAYIRNPQCISMIARDTLDEIVWFEDDSQTAGNIKNIPINSDMCEELETCDIPDLIYEAISQGIVVGTQGKRGKRVVYEVNYKGRRRRIAVQKSKCGKIIGYNFLNNENDKIIKLCLKLEYNTYCLWLCNESGEIIDNCNPPEWENDQELTDTLMAISDLYDSFFVDTKRRFLYKGCINHKTITRLQALITKAEKMLICKNKNKYEIVNKMKLNI